MASLNDFKIFISSKLGEILRERVLPAEVTLGGYRDGDDGRMIVDVTYRGEVYPLTYRKFDVARLLAGHDTKPIVTDLTTIREIIPLFLARYALPLSPIDFVDGALAQINDVGIVPESPIWEGSLRIIVKDPSAALVPIHYFQFDGTGENKGSSALPAGAHTYVEFQGKKWLSVGAPVRIGDSIEFDIRTDFTLDFEIVANSLGDVYGQLFTIDGSTNPTVGNLWTMRSGLFAGAEGRYSMVSVGYTANTEVTTPQLKNDTPMRITLIRQGNNWTWYADGVRVWEYTAKPTLSGPWRFFGSNPQRSKLYLRELRYWGESLDIIDRLKLFDMPHELPQPLNEFLFNGDTDNTGTNGLAMTVPMTYGELGGRNVAFLPAGGPVPFGNGLSMRICGDYTYDFVVIFTATPATYLCFMSPGVATNTATGSFFFYQGRQYEYSVHPGGSAILANPAPVLNKAYRITLRSKGGVTTKYVNGVKMNEYTSPPLTVNRHLTAFRDSGYTWPTNAGIDYIRMWDVGLTDEELAILFTM